MPEKQPNILILWGDDIGLWNISYNSRGQMGYFTPHIDRIASEGIAFTDYYGQQSCTAGRAAFITGQNPVRTGLTKVGMPGADIGMPKEDPTIAELLKPLGYVTGQFGKNHLGDKDEFLPTNHGFDEFFGNLYHLNAIPVEIMTPDRVETRIGTLEFFDGLPSRATAEKVYDNLDLIRVSKHS